MAKSEEPLEYHSASTPDANKRLNTPWKVFLRMLAGTVAGVLACIAGLATANLTHSLAIGMIPPLAIFGVALYVSIGYRRYGYTIGVILAPFLIVAVAFVLLLIICSGKSGV